MAAALWPKPDLAFSGSPGLQSSDPRINYLSAAAAIGAVLLLIEFSVIRGYGFSTPVAEIRMLEVNAVSEGRSGSLLSGIGRLLMPALIVAWIFFRGAVTPVRNSTKWSLFFVTAFVLWAQATFEGGRFFLFALFLTIWFSAVHQDDQNPGGRNKIIYFFGFSVLLFSGYLFIDRYSTSNRAFVDIYAAFSNGFNVDIDYHVNEKLDGAYSSFWFVLMMFWVYITHAVGELDIVLGLPSINHAYGAYQFPQIHQATRLILDISPSFDVTYDLPNPGVYLTTFGGMYVDFSYFGSYLSAAILGAITGIAMEQRNSKRFGRLATSAPLFIVVAIFLPVHSIITTVCPAIVYAWMFSPSCKLDRKSIYKFSGAITE